MAKKTSKAKIKTKVRRSTVGNKNIQLFIIILLLLGGYLLYRSVVANLTTPLQIAEIKNNSGTVNLSLQATKTDLALNGETTVTVTYDSPTDKLTVISGEIAYDPTLLTPSSFVRGTNFPTELIAATAVDGKLTFTYGVAAAAGSGLTGQGNILTFTVKANKAGLANLSFADTTDVRVVGVSSNALREITNTTINISDPTLSPSPSVSSTTESPSPSPSHSPSPSLSPSPSPSASVSIVTKPSAPTNLRYNCYSNGTRITLRWDAVTNATGYEIVLDQKDGDHDQTKSSTRAELDLDLRGNTTYTWKVAAKQDTILSDYSTVNDVKCSTDSTSNNSTPTPTPTPAASKTPTPTPKKSTTPITQKIANVFKKSPSPSPSPKSSVIATNTPTPTPGNLSDIFGSPIPSSVSSQETTHNLWQKIMLGWQALFYRLVESMSR